MSGDAGEVAVVIAASSAADSVATAWDLRNGAELMRYRPCAAHPRCLASVGGRLLAAAQPRASPKSSTSFIFYFSWDKPQVAVRCPTSEPMRSLISDHDGSYLIGGSSSGDVYVWQVGSGQLLARWHAHYQTVTCLALHDALLVSGSQDGTVTVWNLVMMLDEEAREAASQGYLYRFNGHVLAVTDVSYVNGSVIISSSEDRSCKIWCLSRGVVLRTIHFPAIIDCLEVDPRGDRFYAGSRDGLIYVAALSTESIPESKFGKFIYGALVDNSKAVTSLSLTTDGFTLLSGSEDGNIRVWDTRNQRVTRYLKHAKGGPVTNVIVVTKKQAIYSPLPPLQLGVNMAHDETTIFPRAASCYNHETTYFTSNLLKSHLATLQNASLLKDILLEKDTSEARSSKEEAAEWKRRYLEIQDLFVNEVLREQR